jgi:hypothetical protein
MYGLTNHWLARPLVLGNYSATIRGGPARCNSFVEYGKIAKHLIGSDMYLSQ